MSLSDLLPFDVDEFLGWLPYLVAVLNVVVTMWALACVLMTKHDSTSAVAWCLIIFFLFFLLLKYVPFIPIAELKETRFKIEVETRGGPVMGP